MRIAILFGYGLTGSGSTVYVAEFCEALARAGHQVTLFCHEVDVQRLAERGPVRPVGHDEFVVQDATLPSLTIRARKPTIVPVTYLRPDMAEATLLSRLSPSQMRAYVNETAAWIADAESAQPFDAFVVHHLALLVPVAARLCSEIPRCFSVVVHGTGIEYGIRKSPPLRDMVAQALQSRAHIVALNDSVVARVRAELPIADDCIRVVPPGTDVALFVPGDVRRHRSVYVGRVTMDKGLPVLLLAATSIARRIPGFQLDIIGTGVEAEELHTAWRALCGGDVLGFIEQCRVTAHLRRGLHESQAVLAPVLRRAKEWTDEDMSSAENAEDCVKWRGYQTRDEVAESLCTADVAFLPSLTPEAHPLAVCEALAAGVPVLGADRGGIRHILSQVETEVPPLANRLRVPVDADCYATGLANKAVDLLERPVDDDVRSRLRRFVSERFAWPATVAKILADFEQPSAAPQMFDESRRREISNG